MTMIEDWLSEGLAESVANSEAIVKAKEPKVTRAQPAVGTLPLTPAAGPAPSEAKGLGRKGITLGGVIRNPTTVRRTAERVGNTTNVTTLKLNAHSSVKSVPAPTAEEEAKAENPALAFKALVQMEDKESIQPVHVQTEQQSAPSLSGYTVSKLKAVTVGQLLDYAQANGGRFHMAVRGAWVISVELNRN